MYNQNQWHNADIMCVLVICWTWLPRMVLYHTVVLFSPVKNYWLLFVIYYRNVSECPSISEIIVRFEGLSALEINKPIVFNRTNKTAQFLIIFLPQFMIKQNGYFEHLYIYLICIIIQEHTGAYRNIQEHPLWQTISLVNTLHSSKTDVNISINYKLLMIILVGHFKI